MYGYGYGYGYEDCGCGYGYEDCHGHPGAPPIRYDAFADSTLSAVGLVLAEPRSIFFHKCTRQALAPKYLAGP